MDTFIESITSFKADPLNGYFLNRCRTVTPEAKRIVGELRCEFSSRFAVAMKVPVRILVYLDPLT